MKNYYKILQIDKDASPEIIKVAYKLLVKKNHPDLKEGIDKKVAEEKIKEINEAYDILSNPTNKAEYDLKLNNEIISDEQYQIILNENINLKKELSYYKNTNNNFYSNNNYAQTQNTNMYDNTYYQNNSDYIKKSKSILGSFSESIKTLVALFITFTIFFIIFKIPFLYDFFTNVFSNSYIIIIVIIIIVYIYFFKNDQS